MDKINIISSQALLEMPSFSMGTRSLSPSPLVNSLVKNQLFKTAPDIDEPPFQCIHVGFVCGRHNAAWQPRSRSPQDWDLGCLETVGWVQESLAFLDAVVQLLHVRGTVCGALSCWNKVITRHFVYRWQQYYVIMTSWSSIEEVSKRYHQNFLLCNNIEIYRMHCKFRLIQQFLWRSVCGYIFQDSGATNYRWSGKFNYVFVGR